MDEWSSFPLCSFEMEVESDHNARYAIPAPKLYSEVDSILPQVFYISNKWNGL